VGTIHVLRDVTERRRTEEKYLTLFENLREGVFISTPEGRLLDFNDAFQRMLGFDSREELLAVDIPSVLFVDPADREQLKEALAREGAVRGYEFEIRRRDGQVLTVSESSFAERDAEGRAVAYQGFLLDVTARKQAELELVERNVELVRLNEEIRAAYDNLRRTQEQLLQSEKMAAVGQLIAGVAHELNNPLTAILGYSQLLSESPEVTERGADYLHKIYRQAQRTHRIVQNLLSFARQHKPERVAVTLNRVIEDTLLLRDYDLRLNNITVHRACAENLPPCNADPHQLQQVFLNILNNAVDAILEHRRGGEICVRTWVEGGLIHAQITDSGPGVQDPHKVFDPFYTTKPVGKGTGLGLSICYGIVKEHGGSITVRNDPPRGACFEISLPVDRAAGAQAAPPEPTAAGATGARILLVDDEEMVLDLEKEILRGRCLWSKAVSSGREAIEFLNENTVDLVVTDLKMPGEVSGEDLYRWIETHRPALMGRVIFTMSDAGADAVTKLLQRTGCPHVQKPFHLQEFLLAVHQLLASAPADIP
jgi:two-component system NtrC family sensor kinase